MPVKKIVSALRRSPKPHVTLGKLVAVISLGAVLVVGGLLFLVMQPLIESSNNMEFCISCHEMRDQVYEEYIESQHYKNTSGVRAECPDCHVPRELGSKLWAKLMAGKDVWHTLLGTIDTPEKFEAQRWNMATRVWKKFEDSDSRNCKYCHSLESMDLGQQERLGRKKHQEAHKTGKTCIDCHKGLVHSYPEEPEEEEQAAGASEPNGSSG